MAEQNKNSNKVKGTKAGQKSTAKQTTSQAAGSDTKEKTKKRTKKSTKPVAKPSKHGDKDTVTASEYWRFGTGAFLSLFALFMAISIISYTFSPTGDFEYINGTATRSSNILGSLGAGLSYFFVVKNFGVPSLFIAIFLFMSGIRIMEVFKVRLWKWFINCGILCIWFSCLLAGLTETIFQDIQIYGLGGATGLAVMDFLGDWIGPFRWVVLLVTAVAYLCYLSSETIHILRRMMQKPVEMIQEHMKGENDDEEQLMAFIDPETGEVVKGTFEVDEETGKIVNPETGELMTPLEPAALAEVVAGVAAEKTTQDGDVLEWEFRGGEDGPDHPTLEDGKSDASADHTEPAEIDSHTATTIVFSVDGKPIDETSAPEPGKQMELFDDSFQISTGHEEETAQLPTGSQTEATAQSPDGGASNTQPIPNDPSMTVVIGQENEAAELDELGALEPYDPKLDLENYRYPSIDLLKHYDIDTRAIDMDEQTQNKNQIITVLRNFGVEISSIKATVGPTITLYEITPAPGVRISKIRNLEDDIALSLSALGIRIIAPIPGKGTVGIEVPNAKPQIVSMESVINSKKFQESDMELPMALGKTITNEIFMADLAKMPHLLVAGATGQGKSVGLNAIITSLLYKKHPAELKLVMVDPKKVEFSVYSPIVNHFLAQVEGNEDSEEPIITDVSKVIQTLKSLCLEMDTRYDLLKMARARNVKEYNEKFKSRHLNPNLGHKFMPYIVVIIDEFGDLIMTAGKEIELPIARIAQLARAVGIHMIIATQRPTTNIITGTIKANFPARIAFKVSSMIDSRTILDRPGANQLVGKGDMLFFTGTEPVRVQCAFVDTPEVECINNFVACQQSYNGPFALPYVELEGGGDDAPDVDMHNLDPMFEEAARLIVQTQQGSTSMIQRKFSIGYNRAGRLMDQLEVAGIVGPAKGSKPREVLCKGDIELDLKLQELR